MPTHAEKRILPYPAEALFDLVADIERYPEFLPWCLDCRILEEKKRARATEILATLTIGYKLFRESFRSKVTLKDGLVDVEYLDGPFKYLNNHWAFHPLSKKRTEIEFFIDFEFRSKAMQFAMGVVFNEAVRRMISAFEARAAALYDAPDPPAHNKPRRSKA